MHSPHSPNQSISLKHRSNKIGTSVSMDQSKAAGANHQANRTYEDFEPFCKLNDRDNVIEIHVQGFRKEHLSVRTTHTGMLTIHGERPLDQARTKWSRFHRELKLPNNCDANRVAAKFTAGVLTITMPPKIVATQDDDRDSLLPLPTSHVDKNETNNDTSLGKLMKQDNENDKANGENAALLGEEVKEGSSCGFRQRSYFASKKQIAVKIMMVVAAVVGFGIGAYAYVLYKHGRGFYSSPEIEDSFC